MLTVSFRFSAIHHGRAHPFLISYLEHFFGLIKADAKRALAIYSRFVEHVEKVTDFFSIAKRIQYGLGVSIPELKHVTTFIN